MSIKIKQLPDLERPYEKLERYGEKALSDAELLAIIIKSGTREETSVQLAQRLLAQNETAEENLKYITSQSIEELMQNKGIGKVKAIQIKAIGEIATRIFTKTKYNKKRIKEPKDLAEMLMNELKFEKKEITKIIILNTKNEILKIKNIGTGGIRAVKINIQEILAEPIKMKARKFILVHNHPSGDATPSLEDIETTKQIQKASYILGLQLLDHIVIGNKTYTSIFEKVNSLKREAQKMMNQ